MTSTQQTAVAKTIHYDKCPLCESTQIQEAFSTTDFSISRENFSLYRCQHCTFLFTQHVPSPEAIAPYYNSDVYISHSDTKAGFVNRLYHTAREWMLGRKRQLIAQLTTGKKLLDVGSGTGYFLNHMKQNGYEVTGVEIDPGARATTLKNFGIKVAEPSKLLGGDIPHRVDVITLWHVLEHLHDLEGYMQSFHRQLHEDGVLIIAVPNHASHDAQHYGKYWAAYDVPRHLWHFTPETLALLAKRNGFKVVAQKRLPLDPFYNSLLSEKYKSNKLSLIFGAIVGGVALFKSWFNNAISSSPVYILKKK